MAPAGPRLLASALLAVAGALVFFAFASDDAAAQGSSGNNSTADFVFTIKPVGGKAEWAVTKLTIPEGSQVQLVYNSSKSVLPHDIQVCKAGTGGAACATATPPTLLAATTAKGIASDSPAAATGPFAMPKEGAVWVCSVHPEMLGTMTAGAFTGTGAVAEESINHAGVHYLAYWIGVISFALLFVVYGATFFLFKHGETPETTDQKDRPGFEDKRTIAGVSEYVWVVVGLTVVALGVVIFFRIMLSGF